VPFDLLSMFCGALGLPFVKYLIVSLLGLSPTVMPLILAGAHISDPLSARFLVPFGVSLAITLTVFAIFSRATKKL
jgi:uncharacterized membrane protein YdjX (TVP38/TMEM64 family)